MKKYKNMQNSATGRKLTPSEQSRKWKDKFASIDDDIAKGNENIDWKRRKHAEKSFKNWLLTYGLGIFIDDAPSKNCIPILDQMEVAMKDRQNYLLCVARGTGKSCYAAALAMYAIATGARQYVMMIGSNAKSASQLMQDAYRIVQQSDAFAQDYPEIALPHIIAKGSFHRRQLYGGKPTNASKTAFQIVFADLYDEKTNTWRGGQVLAAAGITSGIRGSKHGTKRVDMVILDDLQTSESAANPSQVKKTLELIKKDVMCLGGKSKISIVCLATPIQPDDLVDQLREDKHWKTTIYPAILSYPDDLKKKDSKWAEYFKLYDEELTNDSPHANSLEFYRQHQEEMDKGADVLSEKRYSEGDGHISAIQKLLLIKREIGDDAFASEYMMKPRKETMCVEINPKIVSRKQTENKKNVIPDGYVVTVASTDLNVSYGLTTVVMAFKPDVTAFVVDYFITKTKIPVTLNETEYNRQVYTALATLGQKLKDMPYDIDAWAIDAGGKNFDVVTEFAKHSMTVCKLQACAFAGRSATMFNPFVKSKLRHEQDRTILCGDAQEHIKANAGKKYVFWDADIYKLKAQQAFIAEVGAPGGCTLFKKVGNHADFAIQMSNEKLKSMRRRHDGKTEYQWVSKDPHDYLDAVAQAYAAAASTGISAKEFIQKSNTARLIDDKTKLQLLKAQLMRSKAKPRII